MLFSGDANVGCGEAARNTSTDTMTSNAPMMCTQTSDPDSYPTTIQVWWLMGCTLRQVRVSPQSVTGTPMEGSGLVTHYLPDYKPEYQDTSMRSWYNGTYTEGFLKNTYKNRYKIYKETPDFYGSRPNFNPHPNPRATVTLNRFGRLIGSTYPGQAGQVRC